MFVEGVETFHQSAGVHVAAELVEASEQGAAVGQAVERDAVEHHVFLAVAFRAERAMRRAEEARSGLVVGVVLHFRLEPDERRHRARGLAEQPGDDRAERRPAAGRLVALRTAGQTMEIGVVVHGVGEGTNEGEFVRPLRQSRQVFANLNAGNRCRNRLELAADFQRRIHFEVEHVLVRRAAGQVNHDDRLVRIADAGFGFGLEKLRQGKPAEAERADFQKVATGNAVTETAPGRSVGVDGEHDFNDE